MKTLPTARAPVVLTAGPFCNWSWTDPRYHAIVTANPDAMLAIDHVGKITEWNPAAELIFSCTRDLAIGREALTFLSSLTGSDPMHAEVERVLRTGKGRLLGKRVELTAQRATGSRFPIELTLTCPLQPDPRTFIACVRDITERKHAEALLRQSEERFRVFVESVEDYAIHLLDLHGRILTWNAGAGRIEGFGPRDIIGRRMARLYTPEDIARGKPEQALATAGAEGRYSEEGWSVRKDGSRYWASVVFTALRHKDGTIFGFSRIGCDRTERREAEIDAGRRTAELENRLREFSFAPTLTGGAPHPVATP